MSRIVDWVKWLQANEPVRLYLFTVLTVLVGSLVTAGTINDNIGLLITAGVSAVLGLPLTSALRARVTPTGRVGEIVEQVAVQARTAVDAVTTAAHDSGMVISPDVQAALDRARETADYFGNDGEHRRR